MARKRKSFFILFIFCILLVVGAYFFLPTIFKSTPDLMLEPLTYKARLSGTGSMFPTIPKGSGKSVKDLADETVGTMDLFFYTATPSGIDYLTKKTAVSYGDIVSFTNPTTEEITISQTGRSANFIKRLIGLPGDTIELRDGLVYRNDQLAIEPYVATPHSTFGGEFLHECTKLVIPPGKAFVMGDNRKASNDSRYDLGLINLGDINGLMPLYKQLGTWDTHWHDTKTDASDSARIHFDTIPYLIQLNKYRRDHQKPPLVYNSKLERAAAIRLDAMLKSNDLSYAATQSGVTQAKALAQAGYSNRTWGEHLRIGYYTAEEMYEFDTQSPKLMEFLSSSDFQEIGIAVKSGLLDGCPTQLIVRHFGGYVPPNYSADEIKSWDSALEKEKQAAASWDTGPDTNPDLVELKRLFSRRLQLMTQIVDLHHKNEWVPESVYTENSHLLNQLNALANKLNNQ